MTDNDALSAAADAVQGGEDVAIDGRGAISAAMLLLGGGRLTKAATDFNREIVRIMVGRSNVELPSRDARFADPTWRENLFYRRWGQAYIAFCAGLEGLVQESDVDWRTRERARFALNILSSAVAPTNALVGNPAALKHVFETSGLSLVRGARNYVSDLRHNGGMPSQVDRAKFRVGHDLAATPGAVVYRDEVCEVLQYAPSTPRVRVRPLLCVPPQINKHYIADMSPGRSLAEYMVGRGIPFFIISWRNARPEHRDWTLDTYAASLLRAIDVVLDVSSSDRLDVLGLCAGGITLSTVVSHLAASGDERIASLSLAVTLLDQGTPTTMGMFASPRVLELARRRSQRRGIIDDRSLALMFLWLRPNDLVWNYWVNNYLMGNDPPAFDILAWNADGTNLPAALHAQFLEIFGQNLLIKPEGITVLGTPVDYRQVKCDLYVVGGLTDHLTPWKATYRTTQLFGGPATFVLSNTGHVQTVVCPPSRKAYHLAGPDPGADPDTWLNAAKRTEGTWWEHWADWLMARSAADREAPKKLGSRRHPASDKAPGRYVMGV
jgi:polyhydroxyalkanoate synthase subunit PhaC